MKKKETLKLSVPSYLKVQLHKVAQKSGRTVSRESTLRLIKSLDDYPTLPHSLVSVMSCAQQED